MAEDFHDAFELVGDDGAVVTGHPNGVAFAAIQGLSSKLDQKGDRIANLKQENAELRERLAPLEAQ